MGRPLALNPGANQCTGPACGAKKCFIVAAVAGNITTTVNKGRQAGPMSSLLLLNVYGEDVWELVKLWTKTSSFRWILSTAPCLIAFPGMKFAELLRLLIIVIRSGKGKLLLEIGSWVNWERKTTCMKRQAQRSGWVVKCCRMWEIDRERYIGR